jgi:hypothetical protein
MSDPTTQSGALSGLGIISSLVSGMGEADAGKQQQAGYDYNAQVDLNNMSNDMVANEQKYSALVGKQATAYAASGVDITRGSPLLMMAATAGRGGRQAEEIYQSGTEASTLEEYYGKVAAWKGQVAGIGTFLSGMSKSVQGYLSATGYTGGGSSGIDSTFNASSGMGGMGTVFAP